MASWCPEDTRNAVDQLDRQITRHGNATPILDAERHANFQADLEAELDGWLEEEDDDG